MTDNQKRALLIGIGLVLIVILFFVFRGKDGGPETSESTDVPAEQQPSELIPLGTITDPALLLPATVPPPAPPAETAVRQVARTYAERLGSFSSEGDFVNIEDLYPLMTASYRADRQAYVSAQRTLAFAAAEAPAAVATTTLVLRVDTTLADGEQSQRATVAVETQRVTTRVGAPPSTVVQTMDIVLEKVGDQWLVASALWRPVK